MFPFCFHTKPNTPECQHSCSVSIEADYMEHSTCMSTRPTRFLFLNCLLSPNLSNTLESTLFTLFSIQPLHYTWHCNIMLSYFNQLTVLTISMKVTFLFRFSLLQLYNCKDSLVFHLVSAVLMHQNLILQGFSVLVVNPTVPFLFVVLLGATRDSEFTD